VQCYNDILSKSNKECKILPKSAMIVKFQRTEKAIQKDTILVDLKYDNGDIEDHISKKY